MPASSNRSSSSSTSTSKHKAHLILGGCSNWLGTASKASTQIRSTTFHFLLSNNQSGANEHSRVRGMFFALFISLGAEDSSTAVTAVRMHAWINAASALPEHVLLQKFRYLADNTTETEAEANDSCCCCCTFFQLHTLGFEPKAKAPNAP